MWLTDSKIVAGTDTGSLILVRGGESQSSKRVFPFGSPMQLEFIESAVVCLIARNDMVVATSTSNYLSIFEVRRAPPVSGSGGLAFCLVKLARIMFPTLNIITGIQWSISSTSSNYEVIMSTPNILCSVDLKAGEYKAATVDSSG